MKKFLVWTLAVLLSSCCVSPQMQVHQVKPASMSSAQQVISESAALIRWVDKDGQEVDPPSEMDDGTAVEMRPYCGATWVNDDTLVTAFHCVEHLGRPKVDPLTSLLQAVMGIKPEPWDPTGQMTLYSTADNIQDLPGGGKLRAAFDAKVVKCDRKHDLAVLVTVPEPNVPQPKHLVAHIADSVEVGEDIQVVGHPAGMWWTYTKGTVSAIRPHLLNFDDLPVDSIQISVPIWFGNSGGGAFNASGELVGVCSWMKRAPNMAFFVDKGLVKHLLSTLPGVMALGGSPEAGPGPSKD